ncbi:MAG: glycoside hydrolase family 97 N-terminal domain-containing protein, partial [Bacteroidetes bacterium]|nr:glycoside hydrolase family 97 N-terminal domain-containing protein [Bacteroidota bacterium]
MPSIRLTVFLILLSVSSAFASAITVTSPDKSIVFKLEAGKNGLTYQVTYKGTLLVNNSRLSLSFKGDGEFGPNVKLGQATFKQANEDYDLIVGKTSHVHSLSNEAMVPVTETDGAKRSLNIEIRVFNDGVAFR